MNYRKLSYMSRIHIHRTSEIWGAPTFITNSTSVLEKIIPLSQWMGRFRKLIKYYYITYVTRASLLITHTLIQQWKVCMCVCFVSKNTIYSSLYQIKVKETLWIPQSNKNMSMCWCITFAFTLALKKWRKLYKTF